MLYNDFPPFVTSPSSPLTPRESSRLLYIGRSGGGKYDVGEEVVWET